MDFRFFSEKKKKVIQNKPQKWNENTQYENESISYTTQKLLSPSLSVTLSQVPLEDFHGSLLSVSTGHKSLANMSCLVLKYPSWLP